MKAPSIYQTDPAGSLTPANVKLFLDGKEVVMFNSLKG